MFSACSSKKEYQLAKKGGICLHFAASLFQKAIQENEEN
jgi:hypothetical protein